MHRINLYQTLLTEGQWSYINKVFFENNTTPTVMALEAQSAKWGNRLIDNGYDANKKVKGISARFLLNVPVSFLVGR